MTERKDSPLPAAGLGRRSFINTAALVGLTAGVAACNEKPSAATPAAPAPAAPAASHAAAGANVHLKPGELDTYYGLWSGGHTGDMRVLGLPSGREITRIPCFVPDALVGWGITNESKAIMGTKADGSLKYTVADTHHTHASYKDGNYDGRYAWINDKINSRIARIRLDYFVCDKITELPNVQGFHGIFPDKADPVDPAINYTTRVFCGGEFAIPLPNTGTEDSGKYRSMFSCVDAETMEVRWQVLIDGNCDLVATSYDGKLAATNQYNVEMGAKYEDMMSAERDACLFFNVGRIEAAVKAGKFKTIGTSKVPVVDGTHEANKDPKTALTAYVSVPKNPHGVNASPDGKYFICAGKLSPTGTVIELAKVLDYFDGKLEKLDSAIVAEVALGLGPLHTAFDGRGNAYTTRFLARQVYTLDEFPLAVKDPKESGVFRNGKKVTVKMTSQAPAFSLREFKLKKGDEVTLILTNLDKIEDLTHGFAIPNYNVNFIVNPLETKSVSFVADKPGVFWCYCTHFCHALHLEMRTRMIVEA